MHAIVGGAVSVSFRTAFRAASELGLSRQAWVRRRSDGPGDRIGAPAVLSAARAMRRRGGGT